MEYTLADFTKDEHTAKKFRELMDACGEKHVIDGNGVCYSMRYLEVIKEN